MKKSKTTQEAQNLLWRWNAHRAGEDAFEKSFPAKRCNDPLWKIMWTVVHDHHNDGTIPANGAFNFMTFTERLMEAAGTWPDSGVSPASMKMIQYQANGYAAQDIPAETKSDARMVASQEPLLNVPPGAGSGTEPYYFLKSPGFLKRARRRSRGFHLAFLGR